MTPVAHDPFRLAARAYFIYGVIYLAGGAYLLWHGVGTRGGRAGSGSGAAWVVLGLGLVFLIPYLLRRPRAWFERWLLSRRDFARLLAVFMLVRAWEVGRVALRGDGASVPAPWGGDLPFRVGAAVFFAVTVAALALVARAAWREPGSAP